MAPDKCLRGRTAGSPLNFLARENLASVPRGCNSIHTHKITPYGFTRLFPHSEWAKIKLISILKCSWCFMYSMLNVHGLPLAIICSFDSPCFAEGVTHATWWICTYPDPNILAIIPWNVIHPKSSCIERTRLDASPMKCMWYMMGLNDDVHTDGVEYAGIPCAIHV